jgi:hypothetical protein
MSDAWLVKLRDGTVAHCEMKAPDDDAPERDGGALRRLAIITSPTQVEHPGPLVPRCQELTSGFILSTVEDWWATKRASQSSC